MVSQIHAEENVHDDELVAAIEKTSESAKAPLNSATRESRARIR